MIYRPKPLKREIPAGTIALARSGRNRPLAIYAGAGISFTEPTGLPSGSSLATSIYGRLVGSFPALAGVEPSDLLAVADVVAAQPGGKEVLRLTACASAEFSTATPGFGHRALAYLLLEGVVEVLTTNWDDCIERGAAQERVSAVVNHSDLLQKMGCSVLKVHGCATLPGSVLVTTEDLAKPPKWVVDEVRARLGNSVVVFVGIGDIADYVSSRLSEAVEAVGAVDNVRVVSPSIVTKWSASQWAQVMPDLAEAHRLGLTAEQFLDDLASAHLTAGLQEVVAAYTSDAEMLPLLQRAVSSIEAHDSETVLRWLRRCAVVPRPGESVLRSHPLPNVLAALGVLAGDSFGIGRDGLVHAGGSTYQVLAATASIPWNRVWREASNRLEILLSQGCAPDAAPVFLLAGGSGTKPTVTSLPDNVLGDGDELDIVGGPTSAVPRCLTVDEVLAA